MTDPDVRFNQMIAALKERNFRLTPQRVELVRLIAVSEGHPSASQLLHKNQTPISNHESCNGLQNPHLVERNESGVGDRFA